MVNKEAEYIVILKDGIRYGIELRDVNRLELYSHQSKTRMLDIWVNHKQTLINMDMVISIERNPNYMKTPKSLWQKFISKFKTK